MKIEHQILVGLSQDIKISTWKWEYLNMTFIFPLPRTRRQHDSVWVIVDRMTKSTQFILIKFLDLVKDYVMLYLREIVRFHRVPLSIIFDRGTQFIFQF